MPSGQGSRLNVNSSRGGNEVINVFYVWYTELCRRMNTQPLSNVKPAMPKDDTVLDFVTDRIKVEEWMPIINALKLDTSLHVIAIRSRVQCKFLHDIDTEDKARHMKRRAGSLFTTFILKSLLKSLGYCVRKNCVLSCLELDGLPLSIEHIDGFLESLKKNKSIRILSLKHCTLRDLGCQLLCNALRHMPNVEVLNLTACGLGALSAQYIAKVVKYQQINRYCESWHNSLRYEDPEVGIMAGLKRITLNNNPGIGDEGLAYILDELDDDLWIKAIDMQRCGITENIASRLLDVVDYSRSLEIADFRSNDQLSPKTMERILELLKNKQQFGYDSEYQWCLTTTTLPSASTIDMSSNVSAKVPVKTRSQPFKPTTAPSNISLRRMKTCTAINKKSQEKLSYCPKMRSITDAKKNVINLNEELQKEIAKRIQSELENKKLKEELEKIKSTCTLSPQRAVKFNPATTTRAHKKPAAKPGDSNKVEFVFESKPQPHAILQSLVKGNAESSDSDNDNIEQYFKDIIDENKKGESDKDANSNDSNDSNASLIKFMKEMKYSTDESDNNKTIVWNNCYQKLSVR